MHGPSGASDSHSMKPKVIIVMPAYNAAATLEKTVRDIPEGFADEIIVVDDASQDETVAIALDFFLGPLSLADIPANQGDVRFTPESRHGSVAR